MLINRNTGLILEGGGMRGVFTSGVLDAFMKHQLFFRYVVAVSAGACNGLSYASRQPRRARISNIDMLVKYNYLGIRHLVTQGCIFDPELLYDRFPNELIPYDYDTYFSNDSTFEMVVTNCLTGRAEYLVENSGNRKRLLDIVRASSSLPYVSKIVDVDGVPCLDGGIVDSLPVMRSIETGHHNNVVVMTRNRGYRNTGRDRKIPHFIYKNYPRLRVALSRRIKVYNEQLEMVERMEDNGELAVIRPLRPMDVDRIEKDPVKLEALYEEGFRLGEEFCVKNL
ncbi:MAG: patatin family protein [Prevotella sp.]|nr:patatin family protein [Prevotella sp.]MDD5896119.1 patatin family protein [Prevotellaceae bacterium]